MEVSSHSVFGMSGYVSPNQQMAALVILIFFIVLMDFILDIIGKYAKMYGLEKIFDILKKELTMLGIISFVTFLYIDIGILLQRSTTMFFYCFETMHIVLVFLGFAWVITLVTTPCGHGR